MRILPTMAVMMPIREDQRLIVESPSFGSDDRKARGVRYAAVAATSRVVIYIDTGGYEGFRLK